MIYLHTILGLLLGKLTGYFWPFLLGCAIADVDHLHSYLKHGFRNPKELFRLVQFEEKYKIKARTPIFHSLLGSIFISGLSYLVFKEQAIYFFIGYLTHLLLDIPDKDETPILWPLKYKFIGPLPIWSKPEKIATLIFIIILISILFVY